VAVPRGLMRNQLYPSRTARYVLTPELKELRRKGVSTQRDTEFRVKDYEQRKSKELADLVSEQIRRAKLESEARWIQESTQMSVSISQAMSTL
jgi:hypothetical protein